ncbi:guanine deaminase [Polyplosphaeria fusca]|uniref:Guanine deaminase n=1 Tax=Polyplosphaeria fusca TaxID=682080 RepID=A0A9P4QTT7_9PLEO|nr:guanine deaminase [Polyplosphaeria fusca]
MAASARIKPTIYLGAFVHSVALKELELQEKGAIGVDDNGVIAFVERDVQSIEDVREKHAAFKEADVVEVKDGFFFPGFIDTHTHAPQHPNTGLFGQTTLLSWLQTYTFPMESSLSSLPLARTVYTNFVSRTLSHGTTTCAYYATIHVPATNLLADICHSLGQRALIGRVCMTSSLSPPTYRDASESSALADSLASIQYIRTLDPSAILLHPIVTPRFAPSCTASTLSSLASLASSTHSHIQTHISENVSEVELVRELFPECTSYTHVYDTAGLLTPRTILAHAVHISPAERHIIRERGAKISHCPASNTALTSGCCAVREMLDEGMTVGLGTDVSGGFSPSILEECRQAIWVSRFRAMGGGDRVKISTEEALYLATRGGAAVCGFEEQVGGFEVGMLWDAQMVVLDVVDEERVGERGGFEGKGGVDVFGWETLGERVQKWVYSGDDRNTVAVWVRGRCVHRTGRFKG